jgi:hypothetical protein
VAAELLPLVLPLTDPAVWAGSACTTAVAADLLPAPGDPGTAEAGLGL